MGYEWVYICFEPQGVTQLESEMETEGTQELISFMTFVFLKVGKGDLIPTPDIHVGDTKS